MNMPLLLVLISILGACYLWIGSLATRKMCDEEEYFLMGRKLNFTSLTLTILATQVGGGTLLGAAEEAYQKGWIVALYPTGVCIGLLALAAGFGSRLRRLNLSTVPEIFEKIYRSRALRQVAASLSVVGLFIILVGMGVAARKFFVTIGVEKPYIFAGLWALFVFYTVIGGLRAVVNTDILQMIYIIVCLVAAFFMTVTKLPGSLFGGAGFVSGGVPWSSWLFGPMLYMFIEQDMGQRCFAAKSAKLIPWAAVVSAVLLLCCSLMAITLGVVGAKAGIVVPAGQSVLIATVASLGGPVVATFFTCAVLMAIISTADSLLCSISSNLSFDFPWAKGGVKRAQYVTFFVGMAALLFSFLFNNVVAVLMFSYELSVSVLFVPVLMAVIVKNPPKSAAWGAIVGGCISFVVLRALPWNLPTEIVAPICSVLGFLLGGRFEIVKEVIMEG